MSARRNNPSSIALEECFSAGDDCFLEELRQFPLSKKLESITDKWKTDPRPWAREMVRAYLAEPLDSPGHETVVKRLYKHFEQQRDHEVMGWFMVAFDRVVRRRRVRSYYYDYQNRTGFHYERLRAKPNKLLGGRYAGYYQRPEQRLYSHRTRYYLRRRVWRYFRFLSYSDEAAYRQTLVGALKLYRDEDFAAGENILDNWSLMHAGYFGSPVIRFSASLVHLAQDQTLNELAPAPYRPEVWRDPAAFALLLELLVQAQSSFVRQWAIELIQREHAASISKLELPALLPLLQHADPRVQEFAASLFNQLDSLGALSIEAWLTLLETDNMSVLALLCEAMATHVAPERLDKQQLVQLTNKAAVPVARMGFDLLRQRHASSPFAPAELADLADAQCQALAGEIAAWAFEIIGIEAHYDAELVVRFFDSLQASARGAAIAWLVQDSPGWHDPGLWARLIETPFADVRDALIDRLQQRVKLPGGDCDQLAPLWCAVILGVHRGGRQKPKAVRQIVAAVRQKPERAASLAPVLALAARSIRGPEQRAGLAAVAELAETCPELQPTFAELIPELQLPVALTDGGA